MSDAFVVFVSYAVVYGSTLGYAAYLHFRRKRAQ